MASKAQMLDLADHVIKDPDSRGYDSMTDLERAQDMHSEIIERPKGSTTKYELFCAMKPAEYAALRNGSDADRASFGYVMQYLCPMGDTVPAEAEADTVTFFGRMFGFGSETEANVAALLSATEVLNRAEKLGFYNRTDPQLAQNITRALEMYAAAQARIR